jgi:hypothetical protein
VSTISIGSSSSCKSSATSSGHFITVTITSTLWAGSVIPALSGASIRASACYPAPTGS